MKYQIIYLYSHYLVIKDDEDDSLPEGRFIGFYATWEWDEWGGFPLPSSQTIMGEQFVQGRYVVAWGRFKPVARHRTYRYTTASLSDKRFIVNYSCKSSLA